MIKLLLLFLFFHMRSYFFTFNLSKLKVLFLTCICLSTVACSSGFIYQNLNWVLPWYVDDYVELNDEQKAQFSIILNEGLVWHKKQELPRYQQYLDDVYNKLESPLSEQDVSGIQTFASVSFESLKQYVTPRLLPLFKTLSAEQQKQFWGKLNKKQIEYEEAFLSRSDAEYGDDLTEKYTQFTERLLGTLNEEQQAIINSKVSNIIRADDIWLKVRAAWLDDVKRQYDTQGDDWLMRVQAAWLSRDKHYSAEEQLKVDRRDTQARQLLLAVINSRTEEQNDHFKRFIQEWQGKFNRWQR